jgi:hypothetical protein
MTEGALFWMIAGGLFGGLFFGIALVVTIRGIGELRHLLGWGENRQEHQIP